MKKRFFSGCVWALVVGLSVSALSAGEAGKKFHPDPFSQAAGAGVMPVMDAGAAIAVNSFGVANRFQPAGDPNHLFLMLHAVSVANAPVQPVTGANFAVVLPLTITDNTAVSAVLRAQNDLYITFAHTVVNNGGSLMDWYVEVYLTNLTKEPLPVCYYPVLDLDLFDTFADDTIAVNLADPELGVPSFRLTDGATVGASFAVADLLGIIDSYQLGFVDTVFDRVLDAVNCIELDGSLTTFTGDVAGTARRSIVIPAGDSVYSLFLISRRS